jgi:hypothetical protein
MVGKLWPIAFDGLSDSLAVTTLLKRSAGGPGWFEFGRRVIEGLELHRGVPINPLKLSLTPISAGNLNRFTRREDLNVGSRTNDHRGAGQQDPER